MLLSTLLADEYWLLAHDEATGHPRLSERIAGLGLAGALLSELALLGKIDIGAGGALTVIDQRTPDNPLQHTVLDQIRRERPRSVREWLIYFSHDASNRVADRLAHAGLVTRYESRLPWRGQRWVPADVNTGGAPGALLVSALMRGSQLTTRGALLGGLCLVTGLERTALWEVRTAFPGQIARLRDCVDALPAPLPALVGHTGAVVGHTVASHRA